MRSTIVRVLPLLAAALPLPAQRVLYTIQHGTLLPEVSATPDADGDGFPDFTIATLALGSELTHVSGRRGVAWRTLPTVNGFRPLREVDLDGDGTAELISTSSAWTTGAVMVTPGAVGSKVRPFSVAGATAAPTGDVDGDGVRELMVPSPNFQPPNSTAGLVRVFSGRDGTLLTTVTPPASVVEAFGAGLADLGDVDGDGRPEALIGSFGTAGIFSLADGALLFDLGVQPRNSRYGAAVAALGDVDGDGVTDAAVGAGQQDPGTTGFVRVFSGATGALLREHRGPGGDHFGRAVAGIADVDGDGVGDLAVGAAQLTTAGNQPTGPGYLQVFSGRTGALLFTETGPALALGFGEKVASIGDANGDGRGDVLVGHHPFASGGGRYHAISGRPLTATADRQWVAAATGAQRLSLHVDPALAGSRCVVLGSASGTRPGVALPGALLPLDLDPYLLHTAAVAFGGPGAASFVQGASGTVDAAGSAQATFRPSAIPTIPAALLVGLAFDHAFVVFDPATGAVHVVSDPLPVAIRP